MLVTAIILVFTLLSGFGSVSAAEKGYDFPKLRTDYRLDIIAAEPP